MNNGMATKQIYEMDKFIQRQKLQNVTEKEIENLNKSIKSKKKKKLNL